MGALSYVVGAQVKLTAVMTQPFLNLTLGVWLPSDDRLEEGAVEEEPLVAEQSEGKSSSDRRGEMGPGEVDLELRQETNSFFEQIGFVDLRKDFSISSISSSPPFPDVDDDPTCCAKSAEAVANAALRDMGS